LDPALDDLSAVVFLRSRGRSQGSRRWAPGATQQGEQFAALALEGARTLSARAPSATGSVRTARAGTSEGSRHRPAAEPPRNACSAGSVGDREQAYLDEIARLEAKLQRMRQRNRAGRALQREDAHLGCGHKDDMERLFLHCMHDLQREVQRRRGVAAAMQRCPRGRSGEQRAGRQTSQRERVLELLVDSDGLIDLLYESLLPRRMRASRVNAWDAATSRLPASSLVSSTTGGGDSPFAVGDLFDRSVPVAAQA